MTNFVFDTWKTNAPSENQRASIFTSYFFQHGRHRWHMVGIWVVDSIDLHKIMMRGGGGGGGVTQTVGLWVP